MTFSYDQQQNLVSVAKQRVKFGIKFVGMELATKFLSFINDSPVCVSSFLESDRGTLFVGLQRPEYLRNRHMKILFPSTNFDLSVLCNDAY